MIRPHLVDKRSPFLGEGCALCKEPFGPGEELIICPEDATRHHTHCWRANDNHCSAYGCDGRGQIGVPPPASQPRIIDNEATEADGRVRTLPSSSFGCAQSCLVIAIAAAIVIIAFSCFGLWAIADYLMIEVFGYPYRAPLQEVGPPISQIAQIFLL